MLRESCVLSSSVVSKSVVAAYRVAETRWKTAHNGRQIGHDVGELCFVE